MTEREDRFIQDFEDIEIVSRAPKPRTLLTDDELQVAANRVASGEDLRTVAEETTAMKVAQLLEIPE